MKKELTGMNGRQVASCLRLFFAWTPINSKEMEWVTEHDHVVKLLLWPTCRDRVRRQFGAKCKICYVMTFWNEAACASQDMWPERKAVIGPWRVAGSQPMAHAHRAQWGIRGRGREANESVRLCLGLCGSVIKQSVWFSDPWEEQTFRGSREGVWKRFLARRGMERGEYCAENAPSWCLGRLALDFVISNKQRRTTSYAPYVTNADCSKSICHRLIMTDMMILPRKFGIWRGDDPGVLGDSRN